MAQGDIPTRDDLDRMGKDDLLRLARQFGLDVDDDMTITALRVSLWVHVNSKPSSKSDLNPEELLVTADKEVAIAKTLEPAGPLERAWLSYVTALAEATRLYLAFVGEYHNPED